MRILTKLQWQVGTLLVLLAAFHSAGCDSGWSDPRIEQGPLPLSSPSVPITRLVKTRPTFQITYRQVLWDEGNGLVPIEQRVKPLVEAIPKDLRDRLNSTRVVSYPDGNGTYNQNIYHEWLTVVSVNPDVLIATVRELPFGSSSHPFDDWFYPATASRASYIRQRIEKVRHPELHLYAGTLVPWSDEMYVVSTDPSIEYERLQFEDNQATILFDTGKLVLRRNEGLVEVSRE